MPTIDEAIKIKKNNAKRYSLFMASEEVDAEKLSIEALKAVQRARKDSLPLMSYELEGETEE